MERQMNAIGKVPKAKDFYEEMSVPIALLGEKSKAFEKWEFTKRNGLYFKPGNDVI